ncbi:SURF1 family cytochrome oxidase biogenesis protein [Sphingomonas sp. Mn802worker]|uniref:SURF1 family cytochrome oxidase biogenesis protein n=1 Tax=Sphingomonas sp. Mn802worker TaxID=629773 RepID=UPI0003AB286E|nr:SURF1 family cytochrome oxidase biogenesis protein [Sphingomonas sp. Mn802worker]
MKRFPVVPTIIVALAVCGMIALGIWQIAVRLPEKEAYLAQLARNPAKPIVAFPLHPDDQLLFRRTATTCHPPVSIARAGAGNAGFRLIATCAGTDVKVQLGTTRDPNARVAWDGGIVTGFVSHAPDARPLIAGLFSHVPQVMLLVADRPAAGLNANARPDIGSVPNNHLAYGVQWFLFAGVAAIIYAVAVIRRRAPVAGAEQ